VLINNESGGCAIGGNMKTIAILGSCDTKYKEAAYMRELIEAQGLQVLVIDTATGPGPSYGYDISREELIEAGGSTWECLAPKTKGEKIGFMTQAVAKVTAKLYREGQIQGIISAGGLQNTVIATTAMQALPIGFPKVMATTVASGARIFDMVVGMKDIVVLPSICDFTGLNIVTRRMISNACACCAGMVKHAGKEVHKGDKPVVGVSLMGITNIGACAAVEELEKNGIEVLGFHATGVGGPVMENMAMDSLIDGILDLTTHEITAEYFKGGFSYTENLSDRILKLADKKIPLVISLGGLDFVDFTIREFPPRMDERVYMMHNTTTAHIKILPDEAKEVASLFVQRLNAIDYPVKLLIPTDGMRHNTREGEELYYKEVDSILIDIITANVKDNIEIITIEGNLDTIQWGKQAAHYMLKTLGVE